MFSSAVRKAQEKPTKRERRPSKCNKSSRKTSLPPSCSDDSPSWLLSRAKDPASTDPTSNTTCTGLACPASSPQPPRKKIPNAINTAFPLTPKATKSKIREKAPVTPATAATSTTNDRKSEKKPVEEPSPRRVGMKIYTDSNADSLSCITMLTADFPEAKQPPPMSVPIVEEDLEPSNHSSSNKGWATFDNSPFAELNNSNASNSFHGSEKSASRKRANTLLADSIHTCFFTFRRGDKETTIKGNISAGAHEASEFCSLGSGSAHRHEDESMADIVRRLQQSSSSGVLRFSKSDVKDLKDARKHLMFALPTCGGKPKFTKEEFGNLRVSEVVSLSTDHPVLVEICMEDAEEGETYEVF